MNHIKKYIKSASLSLAMVMLLFSCTNDDGYFKGDIVKSDLAPVVSFTASETSVFFGSSVTFTDTSTGTPSLWTWNMPGATPSYSNEANPTVLYQSAGVYDVTLTVRNEHGADETVLVDYIEVTAPPIVDIDTKAQVRYTFDDDNLDSDLDKGIQDITATAGGATQYAIRPGGGGAYVCSGSNPLTIPGYTGVNGAGSRSVALWIKTTHAGTSGLVHWGNAGTFSRSSFKMQNTGVLRYEYQGGGHNASTVVNDGTWHHVAYTYDGDTIKIYVDGTEDFSVSGITVINTGNTGETDVNIGSQLGGSVWQGTMDDVRIFDTVLTPAEVLTLSEID
ncbi:LamG-like jellyroll fold domain-containing protein [Flavivirga spongiicola]|uniref:PKD domain-containing protein n=1 Tax=Flavivirga spongiicola TaxID=421621 RepID=A0ABU7XWT2_9FLAO|nr:LamG-like jellyroll fold domain-containing protein [Flavivirga sp. MEBiC05379]MDO5980229.1 LamG-like jellyroll fold domain-containing protein [Flavivirga sp. MEBiC05379]